MGNCRSRWKRLLSIFFLSACLVVLVNLAVDLVYLALDPRISVE